MKQEPVRLDSVLISIDGVDHQIPLESQELVEVHSLQGACLTPDLKHARLLKKGADCDDGWVAVKGNAVK